MRTATVLQQARLCGSTRLTFDDEELTLSRESTETADGTAVASTSDPQATASVPVVPASSPSAAAVGTSAQRRSRRVTFLGNEGLSTTYESVPEGSKSLDHPLPPPLGAQASTSGVDEADSRSLFYR